MHSPQNSEGHLVVGHKDGSHLIAAGHEALALFVA